MPSLYSLDDERKAYASAIASGDFAAAGHIRQRVRRKFGQDATAWAPRRIHVNPISPWARKRLPSFSEGSPSNV